MKKRIISLLLAFVMIVGLVPASVTSVFAEENETEIGKKYYYIDKDGSTKWVVPDGYITKAKNEYTTGYYVLKSDVLFPDPIVINGDVHIILCDGRTLSANAGILLLQENSLSIYAQSKGRDKGRIFATGDMRFAGIGGDETEPAGKLVVCGGEINANGGQYAAGIGAGFNAYGCDFSIYEGVVKATGGLYASGIGSGMAYDDNMSGYEGTVSYYGGTLIAQGKNQTAGIDHCTLCSDITPFVKAGDEAPGIATTLSDYAENRNPYVAVYKSQIIKFEEVAPSCDRFGTKEYYLDVDSGTYYRDEELTDVIGDEAAFSSWMSPMSLEEVENSGIYLPLGHLGVCAEDINEGHYCVRPGCDECENGEIIMHDLNDDNTACPICGTPATYGIDSIGNTFYVFYAPFNDDGKPLTQTWYYFDKSVELTHPIIITRDFAGFVLADGVTVTARAGYYLTDGSTFGLEYQSQGSERGTFIGTEYRCYDEAHGEIFYDHIDEDDNHGICDRCGEEIVGYIDENGEHVYMDDVTAYTSDMTTIESGWYYVNNNRILFNDPLTVKGDVHIILNDGCSLSSQHGIVVPKNSTLHIYSQSFGERMGRIDAKCTNIGLRGMAAIGGSFEDYNAGTIIINGGNITANGGVGGAGIGGAMGGKGGTVIINNGIVTAKGGVGAAGIGGGFNGDGETVIINGGTVNAKAGLGAVAEEGGAGIGGGYNGLNGTIEINNVKKLSANGYRALGAGYGMNQTASSIKVASRLNATSNGSPVTDYDVATDIVIVPDDKFDAVSLTLSSDIYINYYMLISKEEAENGKMEFTIGNRKVNSDEIQLKHDANSGRYYYSCPVNALEMNEKITATFTCNEEKHTITYSIMEYVNSIIDGKDKNGNPYSDGIKLLAYKLANYGHYVQIYLSELHTDVTIGGNGYSEIEKFSDYDIDVDEVKSALTDGLVVPTKKDGISLYGRSINFDGAIALNYYIKAENGAMPDAADIICQSASGESRNFTLDKYNGADNVYVVSIKDIKVLELNAPFTLSVGGYELTGSVLDYCGAVISAHTAKEDVSTSAVDAMSAFYEYYKAVNAWSKGNNY